MYKFSVHSIFLPLLLPRCLLPDTQLKEPVPVQTPLYAPLPPKPKSISTQASTFSLFLRKNIHLSSPHKQKPTVIQWRTSLEGRDDIRFCAAADAYQPHLAPSLSASSLAILSSSPSTTAPLRRPFFRPFLTSSLSSLLLFLPAPAIPASPAIRCASLSRRSRFRASRSSSCGSLSFCAGAAGGVGSAEVEDFCGFSFSRSWVREREGSWREERES